MAKLFRKSSIESDKKEDEDYHIDEKKARD